MDGSVEGSSTTASGSTDDSQTPLGDNLDSLCEYYMAMGVPYEEFWFGDYCKLKYYEAVYLKKRKVKNEEMWMMGAYFYSALATALSNAFREKNKQAQEYMRKPIQFFPLTPEEEKAEQEQLRQRIINNLNRLKEEWDNTHG